MSNKIEIKYKDGGGVCIDCGEKYGRKLEHMATFHHGKCVICGKKRSVTQPRDFNLTVKE